MGGRERTCVILSTIGKLKTAFSTSPIRNKQTKKANLFNTHFSHCKLQVKIRSIINMWKERGRVGREGE